MVSRQLCGLKRHQKFKVYYDVFWLSSGSVVLNNEETNVMRLHRENVAAVHAAWIQFMNEVKDLPLILNQEGIEQVLRAYLDLIGPANAFITEHERVRDDDLTAGELQFRIAVHKIWSVGIGFFDYPSSGRGAGVADTYKIMGEVLEAIPFMEAGLGQMSSA